MVKKRSGVASLERGDIIKLSFDPTLGHEQSGYRPALVVSSTTFHSATGFALCLPITSKKKGLLFEIEIQGKVIRGVALPHGARMLDLQHRDFQFVEKGSVEVTEKAQTILSKIVLE